MKRPSRGCLVFLLVGMLGVAGGTAWADDPQPVPSGGAPAPMAMPRKFTGDQQSFFIAGGVADSATWSVGTVFPQGFSLSIGVDLTYNGNGLAAGSSDKLALAGVLYGAYYFYNKFPVGLAVEAAVVAPLLPTAGSPVTIIQPGIGVFYAPFPAPIALSSGLDLAITIPKSGSTTIQTVTPGLRIIYVF